MQCNVFGSVNQHHQAKLLVCFEQNKRFKVLDIKMFYFRKYYVTKQMVLEKRLMSTQAC